MRENSATHNFITDCISLSHDQLLDKFRALGNKIPLDVLTTSEILTLAAILQTIHDRINRHDDRPAAPVLQLYRGGVERSSAH